MSFVKSSIQLAWFSLVLLACKPVGVGSNLMVDDRYPELGLLKRECPKNQRVGKQTISQLGEGVTFMSLANDACGNSNSSYGLDEVPARKVAVIFNNQKNDPSGEVYASSLKVINQYKAAGWEVATVDIGQVNASGDNTMGDANRSTQISMLLGQQLQKTGGNISKADVYVFDHGSNQAETTSDYNSKIESLQNAGVNLPQIDPRSRFPTVGSSDPTYPHYLGDVRTDLLLSGAATSLKSTGFDPASGQMVGVVSSCYSGACVPFIEKSATSQAENIRNMYSGVLTSASKSNAAHVANLGFAEDFAKISSTGNYDARYDGDRDGFISMEEVGEGIREQQIKTNTSSTSAKVGMGLINTFYGSERFNQAGNNLYNPQYPTYQGEAIIAQKPDAVRASTQEVSVPEETPTDSGAQLPYGEQAIP